MQSDSDSDESLRNQNTVTKINKKNIQMKILCTSDLHLGNMFHGNNRLPEHQHFLSWLRKQINEQKPDALLVAGDVFDNGNPSAASQSAYYTFLADTTTECPTMKTIITAGNHDSANRLEAPRELLSRHNVEVRGTVPRVWNQTSSKWEINYTDLMIPIDIDNTVVVLTVPYLRFDIVQGYGNNYSAGVNGFLRELTKQARTEYPGATLVMMAHMYATGADIANSDASEKIVIGGQEQVDMEGWDDHPDYMTCGHIHKRQHIWNTHWARYTGSVLPMSVAEADYKHGIDMLTLEDGKIKTEFIEYTPQHRLVVLPADDKEYSCKELQKTINGALADRKNGELDENYDYVFVNANMKKITNDDIKKLESIFERKNAILCKIKRIMPDLEVGTINNNMPISSIDDILNRDPLDAIKEALLEAQKEMSEEEEQIIKEIIESTTQESTEK